MSKNSPFISPLIKAIRDGDRNEPGKKPRFLNITRECYDLSLNIIISGQWLDDPEPATGMTPLMICLERYNGLARFLINKGTQNDLRDHQGRTALHYATLYAQNNELAELIKKGAPLDAQDNCGKTPLIFALQNGNLDAAICLMQAGAKIDTSLPENAHLNKLIDAHKAHASYPLAVSALLERRRQEAAMSMTQTPTKLFPKMKITLRRP